MASVMEKQHTKPMEEEQKKKNVVEYNLPESEEEQVKDRYREGEKACIKFFEEKWKWRTNGAETIDQTSEKNRSIKSDQYW